VAEQNDDWYGNALENTRTWRWKDNTSMDLSEGVV
jgi:hypothetical protein